ncbi:MAG: hypothetical protein KDA96_00785 [Planctomycetaceae bacterium]|nr:hypothetical protein [Planctomycetaceae bacterium]
MIVVFLTGLVSVMIFRQLWQLYEVTQGLTLRTAWWWSIPAVLIGVLGAMIAGLADAHQPAIADAFLDLTAIAALAPFVAILGARRPGAAAWPWFVVLPMLIVLSWPTMSQVMGSDLTRSLAPCVPAAFGILLVTVMGTGNYFGSGNTSAFFSSAVAVSLLTSRHFGFHWRSDLQFLASGLLLMAALQFACRRIANLRHMPCGTQLERMNRTWFLFRDLYGIVWARRVMDRVNQFAVREKWQLRLSLDGFEPHPDNPGKIDHPELDRPTEIFVWILRRFASTDWIAQHLNVIVTNPANASASGTSQT